MSLSSEQIKQLNNMNPTAAKAKLGDRLDNVEKAVGNIKQGVAVEDAAGANPTAAEFKALLDSLRDAGVIASA